MRDDPLEIRAPEISAPDISALDISALAINVTIPEPLRWTDTRRGEEYALSTLNVRLLPDGRLAAKAYGRPTAGGRAGDLWAGHHGLS